MLVATITFGLDHHFNTKKLIFLFFLFLFFFFFQWLAKSWNCFVLQLNLFPHCHGNWRTYDVLINCHTSLISYNNFVCFWHAVKSSSVKWTETNTIISNPLFVASENVTVSVSFEYVINIFISNGYMF